jgi:hypothetical protein
VIDIDTSLILMPGKELRYSAKITLHDGAQPASVPTAYLRTVVRGGIPALSRETHTAEAKIRNYYSLLFRQYRSRKRMPVPELRGLLDCWRHVYMDELAVRD